MPTVVIGNNTGDDYSGVDDALIYSPLPTDNWGSSDFIQVQNYSAARSCSLICFTGLSSIDGPVEVSSAIMSLRWDNDWGSYTCHIRSVLRAWVESQVNYNIYSTGNNWTTAGCLGDGTDRDADAIGTIVCTMTDQYQDSSSTSNGMESLVQDCINGDADNDGVVVTRDTLDSYEYFRGPSSEGTDGQRPYLTVTYTESGGASIAPLVRHYQGMDMI